MAAVYQMHKDDEDLCREVWINGCVMLSKTAIKNWAVAYHANPKSVREKVNKIINCSYRDKFGNWKIVFRITMGYEISGNLCSEVKAAVQRSKTTGIPITKSDMANIANRCQVPTCAVEDLINDMM